MDEPQNRPLTGFESLDLSHQTLKAIADLGGPPPGPYEQEALPALLARRDLFSVGMSGPDSERALALNAIERVLRDGPAYRPTALVLVPDREASIRFHETAFQLSSRGSAARILGLVEGKPLTSQIGPLKHGTDIVVGTPGRVAEHVKRKTLRIEQLKILALDRADQMLDLGPKLRAIIEVTPATRQTIITAGSESDSTLSMAHRLLRDPVLIGVTPEEFGAAVPEEPSSPMTNLHFDLGKGAGVRPGDLVGVVTREGGLDADLIGEIKIKQNFSLVAVPVSDADGLVRKLKASRLKGRKTKVRLERFRAKGR
jgi:superfamily II DNA/RNA helicase